MSFASSGGQEIAVSATEIKLGPQTVYTDGRPHPDTKSPAYKATGNGHSTGRWQGDTLLVDTVGFPAKMCDTRWRIMRVTGGGRAKETTHLTQRVRLTDAEHAADHVYVGRSDDLSRTLHLHLHVQTDPEAR